MREKRKAKTGYDHRHSVAASSVSDSGPTLCETILRVQYGTVALHSPAFACRFTEKRRAE
jgi:hypothetical protein